MMIPIMRLLLALSLVVCLWVSPARADEIRIALATNFKTTGDQLKADFEARSDHTLILSAGSTGKLYAQIINGAPFDIFLSADKAHPKRLIENGYAISGTHDTYAIGRLALWSAGKEVNEESLRMGTFRTLAIANPALAPYGAAAMEILQHLKISTSEKIVRGENIGQAFAFVATGAADIGLVSLSQILSLPEERRGQYWLPGDDLYTPIRQDGVLLTRARDSDAARAFLIYLQSDEAKAIIAASGYTVP